MFRHIFIYNLKSIVRNRAVIFWSLIYPIALATLFHFAFANLTRSDTFTPINIALVSGSEISEGTAFHSALSSISDIDGKAEKSDIFRAKTVTAEQADGLLKDGAISAYILYDNDLRMVVGRTGFYQTITKMFLDDYLQSSATISSILSENPDAANQGLFEDIFQREAYLKEVPASSSSGSDITVIYFYALLAMTCLMGSTVAIDEIIKLQANMSPLAARINTAPIAKFRIFLYNLCATILFQLIVIMIVLAYLIFGLKVDFGHRSLYVLLTCLVGGITGVFFGTAVSAGFKAVGVKYAITIGGTMLSCFLAGMMNIDMKYIIQEHAPLIKYISPATLISDAFYSLYYYDGFARYLMNMSILCALSVVLCTVTCVILRRKSYASI